VVSRQASSSSRALRRCDESSARCWAAPLKRGWSIGAFDAMIAAHALAKKLVLVTSNERHFRKVLGLKIENWT
jgi:tRNA(fMet)-specific endonuclease VapC